jgi:imidazolonepropionase-like amidohydrolase
VLGIKARRTFDGERVIADGSVVLVDGRRIADILPPGASLPTGCSVADFPKATLLPGLIDTHVHLCCDSGDGSLYRIATVSDTEMLAVIETALGQQLAAGVTTVRDLGDRRWAVVDWRDRHRDGGPLPTVLASGPPLTVAEGHCADWGDVAQGEGELRNAVREHAEHGVDVVKIMASGGVNTPETDPARAQFSVAEIRAVVAEAHAAGLPVTAHAHATEGIRNALAADVDALEHATFITDTGVEVDDQLVATMAESAIPVCPTLGVAPGVVPPPAVAELLRRIGVSIEARAQVVGEMHRAGVRIVSGSDGGINRGKRHGILPESLIALADGGVSNTDVLASATSVAADACGVGDRKGRLAAGFNADLLLVDGDPVADIAVLRNVDAVYVGGQLATPSSSSS